MWKDHMYTIGLSLGAEAVVMALLVAASSVWPPGFT
jgi:hypothetical protein